MSPVDAFVSAPSDATLDAAKGAWRAARVPYQQTEAFRFGNPTVDDWEGNVNAWPLAKGLIDYVDGDHGMNEENPLAGVNVIANPIFDLSGTTVGATEITPALIESLLEIDGIEANVASGYHAIEFLLWGQDLNGTDHGAGARPATDFDTEASTGGNCDRRADHLAAASALLVADLEGAVANRSDGGQGRADVTADSTQGLVMACTGLGSLSYGEQAGDRMKLGLLLHEPEEGHDCFSDNTHNSHCDDGLSLRNVYTGRYVRVDGSVVSGPSLHDLVREVDPSVGAALLSDLYTTMTALGDLRTPAEAGMS